MGELTKLPNIAAKLEEQLAGHEFAPDVKLGMVKKLFGKLMNGLLGKAMKASW